MKSDKLPDFKYPSIEIVRFINAANLFTLLLKSGRVVHFTPQDFEKFRQWLIEHGIDDVRESSNDFVLHNLLQG